MQCLFFFYLYVVSQHGLCVLTDVTHDTDLTPKVSPWDPVHTGGAPNGAHAVTGGNIAAGGIDDEFDLLSSRSKSPPTTAVTSAGTCGIDNGLILLTVDLFGAK